MAKLPDWLYWPTTIVVTIMWFVVSIVGIVLGLTLLYAIFALPIIFAFKFIMYVLGIL